MDTLAIDIEIFRKTPDVLRESQRKRFKSVELVDDVIRTDEQWRKSLQLLFISYLLIFCRSFSGFRIKSIKKSKECKGQGNRPKTQGMVFLLPDYLLLFRKTKM